MSAVTSRIQDQRRTAELAADFNDFYQQITSPRITHVGNYRIVREIGEGAFGKVYLAQHVLLHSQVVLKCGKIDDPNIVREIYYHKQLKHRNIVKLFEVVKTETQLWIVLEYCEGNELFYHIYEKRRLDIESTKSIFYQIVEGIRYVHSLNLAHRDLKLENILMADTKKTIVKLTDFGFVREFNPSKRSFLSTVCGTTAYMAPEVLNGVKYSGFAIDIWSMGVILYAMVYGELPFDEDDEIKTKIKITTEEPNYRDSVAEEVNSLIKHMLTKDPSKRATLSEIQNSSLLIDMTNARLSRRNSSQNDSDSLISINQYYKANTLPFQTRIEKHLLKKLEKSNIDIQALQDSKLNGQDNVLTAFYELALTSEFEKKKKRHLKKKRYYEAKHQLRKSTNRVKSVLSLSEQSPGSTIPLERILTSLSLNSRQEPSPTTNQRQESILETKIQFSPEPSPGIRSSSLSKQVNNESSLMGRTVSFYTDDTRNSSISRSDEPPPNSKGKQIIEKLRFWKKLKPNKNETARSDNIETILNSSSTNVSSIDDNALKIDIPSEPVMSSEMDPDVTDQFTPTFTKNSEKLDVGSGEDTNLHLEHFTNSSDMQTNTRLSSVSNDSYGRRPRPESVISQFSSQSQQSHLYNMSEYEYDLMDGSDDELFDDDVYNSSINTSQQDLQHRSSVVSSTSKRFRRPPNFRSYSDTSILSSSTSATKRRSTLTRFSSNSSNESSAHMKADEGSSSGAGTSRPNSPRLRLKRKAKSKSRGSKSSHSPKNSYNGQILTPAPVHPQNPNRIVDRCYSPPAGRKAGKQANSGGNGQLFTVLPNNLRRLSASNNFTSTSIKGPTKGADSEQASRKFEGTSITAASGKFELINEEEEE